MGKLALESSCKLGMASNILLPAVPAGIALHYAKPDAHLAIFILNYLAMVPMANLLAFAAMSYSRKLRPAWGVVFETSMGSAVELILTLVLLFDNQFQVIQGVFLGSVLTNCSLVMGLCFVAGGIRHREQRFDEIVAETGGSLLLLSAVGLLMPAAYATSIGSSGRVEPEKLARDILSVSRSTAVLLLVAFIIFMLFQLKTQDFLFDRALYKSHINGTDYYEDKVKEKLTDAESLFLCVVALALVTLHALFLVSQIHWMVLNRDISDAFVGLILVPLVEKVGEHFASMNEAWDNTMDFALSHVLGGSIQTALFVAPLVVIIGWIAGKPLDLNFELFQVVVYFLGVLIVGNAIRDRKTNYLEGSLSVIFYLIVAVTAFYYPNPEGFEDHHH
ncbi:hypothetical protein BJ508DRAFT_316665 [Ascobolus immersus RN42]|uniref:Vacuolar calcium ion transporter n=1 Tax=Ascobolus immersus RN42 TaxID=1160509 RepID=A0A3N4INB6_ASCIM|nr:hypothetical protein BJ508DRAFT_316665 [Ascobolus immersus RN42]